MLKNQRKIVLRFEMRYYELGAWIELEVPYTKANWDWAVNHPDTRYIRKVLESTKPIVTFNA